MSDAFSIAPLAATDDRVGFSCGTEPLDRYFREFVTQDIKRRVASCYAAKSVAGGIIAGFYTLSASGIPITGLPADFAKKLPRYPLVPATLLGRLAVDRHHQGKGYGRFLLADALYRAMRNEIASFAVIVDAKDDQAAAFYLKHGFTPFESRPLSMFLPIATALKLFG